MIEMAALIDSARQIDPGGFFFGGIMRRMLDIARGLYGTVWLIVYLLRYEGRRDAE